MSTTTNTTAAGVHNATGHVATLGHPADGVVIQDGLHTTNTTNTHTSTTHAAHPAATTTTTHNKDHAKDHGKDHSHEHKPASNTAMTGVTGANDTLGTDTVVKTGNYVTGLEHHAVNPTPIPVVGNSHQNRIVGMAGAAGPVPRDNAGPLHTGVAGAPTGVSGPLGGAVVLGGQCECLMNGGTCKHGPGQCKCRGCSTAATTVNPGMNIGISNTVDHTATNPHTMN